ncbi:MAG: GNAT family N-acetyltransferase [Alphaproteobacteria bacterium]|nr:GNAT family N-acetyltransferase [Alphaproteobacteria bacterium]
MSAPPKTVLKATADEEQAIRAAVRNADPATLGPGRAIAKREHASSLLELLADPAVSDAIYDLPRPLNLETIAEWIEDCAAQQQRGEGLLFVTLDREGKAAGYSKITVWPDRSSAELAGALRADLQNSGAGGSGALHTFSWIFETLGVRLMCLTAAVDNIRSARLIDRGGFVRMGEREAVRPDGTTRRSIYWELTRDHWNELLARDRGT